MFVRAPPARVGPEGGVEGSKASGTPFGVPAPRRGRPRVDGGENAAPPSGRAPAPVEAGRETSTSSAAITGSAARGRSCRRPDPRAPAPARAKKPHEVGRAIRKRQSISIGGQCPRCCGVERGCVRRHSSFRASACSGARYVLADSGEPRPVDRAPQRNRGRRSPQSMIRGRGGRVEGEEGAGRAPEVVFRRRVCYHPGKAHARAPVGSGSTTTLLR